MPQKKIQEKADRRGGEDKLEVDKSSDTSSLDDLMMPLILAVRELPCARLIQTLQYSPDNNSYLGPGPATHHYSLSTDCHESWCRDRWREQSTTAVARKTTARVRLSPHTERGKGGRNGATRTDHCVSKSEYPRPSRTLLRIESGSKSRSPLFPAVGFLKTASGKLLPAGQLAPEGCKRRLQWCMMTHNSCHSKRKGERNEHKKLSVKTRRKKMK